MKNIVKIFRDKITRKQIEIGIVGLGYVGLPLALEFAGRGIKVSGIEVDRQRLEHLEKKESYITDVPASGLRKVLRLGNFKASGDFAALKRCDVVIICVPTPLKRKYHPDISYIKEAVKGIRANLKKGSLIILESTTYPGTTEEVILPMLESNGLKNNRDFYLSFSPERIDPGNKVFPVHKIPKVVGGTSKEATELTCAVYRNIIERIVPVSSARTAEAVKLLENTFRLVNIALIDEMAMMAHKMKIDIWEVVNAASTKPFGFMPFYPGPGVGGHCIPKDPLYLFWKAKHHFGFHSRFIKLASDIINYMPEYVVERVASGLKERGKMLKGAEVLVIGLTYKKNIKDLRKSPSIDIVKCLKEKGAEVRYFDPLIPYLDFGGLKLRSVSLSKEALKKTDCVVIATDHSGIDYSFIIRHAAFVFDTRRVYKGKNRKVVAL